MRLLILLLLVFSASSDETLKCTQGKFEPHRDSYKTKKASICYTSFTVKKCNYVDIHMFSDRKGSSGARKSLVEALGESKPLKLGATECDVVPGHSAVLCRCGRDRCNKNAEELLKAVSTLIRNSKETRLLECVKERVYRMDDEDSGELIDDDGNPIEEGVVWEDDELDEPFWDPNEEYKRRHRQQLRQKKNVKEWYDPWGIVAVTFGVIFFLIITIYFECIASENPKKRRRQREINELRDEENLQIDHENQVIERLFTHGIAGLQRQSSGPVMRISRLEQTSSATLLEIPSATTVVEMPEAVSPVLVTARSPPQEYLSQSETSSVPTTNRQSTSRQSTSRTSNTSTSPKYKVVQSLELSKTSSEQASKEKKTN